MENLIRNGEDTHFYFGFASPEQLLDWFHSDEFHEEAENAGYRVSVVQVAGRVFHGTYQLVFERDKSTVTRRCTFAELRQMTH